MTITRSLSGMILLTICGFGAALAQNTSPADDQPMSVNGVETVCTGTTTDARQDPRWNAYSLRLEFVGANGQFLGDEKVDVAGGGQTISVHCDGPWVLMKLPAGAYKIATDVAQAGHKDVTAQVPKTGQAQVIVRFPAAGGSTEN